ncbi:MAG: magnesium transporter, partial [Planctomycetaceae bacterium]|nr:magnesium transporter [Planctomycetaceae bacterium]
HIFQLLARAEREDIRRLQSYEENSTGAVMTSDYALVPADETAAAAIERLRHVAPDRETIYYCYVVDEDRHLKGFVSLKNLIIAPAHRRVADIMQRDCVYANVNDDREATAEKLREYDLLALPVVDNEHRLVGIVTHDDVIDVIVDEATEDVHRMGGVGPLEETYLESSFRQLWLNRALWLSILFVAGFLTALALEKFQGAFEEVPALVFFIPLIISAGGNCGSQSATLIMRALALGELTPRDWFRVFNREVLMGFSLGLGLG